MQIYADSKEYDAGRKRSAIGLGTFDGLHAGHMKLIGTLTEEAGKRNLTSVLYTFTGDPDDVLKKGYHTHILTGFDAKAALLRKTGLDYLCVDEFTSDYAKTGAEEFVSEILVKRLGMKLAVCGFNYTYGRYKKGNVETLQSLKEKYGFDLIVIPPVIIDGEIVSSTLIRKLITHGDMTRAAVFLGRPYMLSGEVIKGESVGRKLGFPTANILPPEHAAVPLYGVYVTRTTLDGKLYESVTNVGLRPTFDSGLSDRERTPIIETHILKETVPLYGKNIDVAFLKKIRSEFKFTEVEKLIQRIRLDIIEAEKYFSDLTVDRPMLE